LRSRAGVMQVTALGQGLNHPEQCGKRELLRDRWRFSMVNFLAVELESARIFGVLQGENWINLSYAVVDDLNCSQRSLAGRVAGLLADCKQVRANARRMVVQNHELMRITGRTVPSETMSHLHPTCGTEAL